MHLWDARLYALALPPLHTANCHHSLIAWFHPSRKLMAQGGLLGFWGVGNPETPGSSPARKPPRFARPFKGVFRVRRLPSTCPASTRTSASFHQQLLAGRLPPEGPRFLLTFGPALRLVQSRASRLLGSNLLGSRGKGSGTPRVPSTRCARHASPCFFLADERPAMC